MIVPANRAKCVTTAHALASETLDMTSRPAGTSSTGGRPRPDDSPSAATRIAVGVDGYAEGRDAAVLAATIARATTADVILVAVHPDPEIPMPREMNWKALHEQAAGELRKVRDDVLPDALTVVETNWSVPEALERVVSESRRDLLVLGSSRRGREGRVRIGDTTRQLLGDALCALAVAPRGFGERPEPQLSLIGVGYDGGAQAREALEQAASLALAAGARLRIRAVVDDRLPRVAWAPIGGSPPIGGIESLIGGEESLSAKWDEVLAPRVDSLREDARRAASATGCDFEVEAMVGSPADALTEVSRQVDLLVIGSRRWGTAARVLLGSTGEALMRGARGPVMVVPRAPAA
jgi:nucleotide-binding universal stress UspA family protein